MPAFSIQGMILVLSYLVHHPIAATSDNGSFHLVENNARRNAMCTDESSKCQAFRFTYFPARYPQQPPPSPPIRATKLSASIRMLLVASSPTMSPPPPTPPTVPPATAVTGASPSSGTNQLLNFTDIRLAVVYPVIQKFKTSVTSDPFNITGTWVGADICSYKGFYCSNPPDNLSAIALASIDFNGYHLRAPTLDGFIDQLPDLALFHANSNFFSGTISPNISNLPYLYEIDISNNAFSGSFPAAVVGLNGLIFLDVRFNMFSGLVPPAIFTQNLDVLFLNDNSFMSSMPASLGKTHIEYLTLADNKFTGQIPSDISKLLSNVTEVLLENNQFAGCLPYQLGLLKQLMLLDISKNQLTGPLAFSFGCLENAEVLNFAENLLYGIVPDLVCELPNLANLTLSRNYFQGLGQACWNLIKSGVLDARNNCIPGLPFQRSVVQCATFFASPRICPYMDTYTIIPCKLPRLGS